MTHHNEPDLSGTVLQLLTTQGSSKLADCIWLTIEDNGRGLPSHTGEIIHSPSLGMVGMRARARQSGGGLTATSEMPQGLRIKMAISPKTPAA